MARQRRRSPLERRSRTKPLAGAAGSGRMAGANAATRLGSGFGAPATEGTEATMARTTQQHPATWAPIDIGGSFREPPGQAFLLHPRSAPTIRMSSGAREYGVALRPRPRLCL